MIEVRAEFVPDDWDGKDGSDMCMAVFVDNRLGYVWSDEHPMYVLVRQLQDQLESRPAYGTSACGHSEQFVDWEDHSTPIVCLKCEVEKVRSKLTAAEAQAEAMTKGLVKSSAAKIELESRLVEARALLREACEYEVWISHGEREYAMSADWRKRAVAAGGVE